MFQITLFKAQQPNLERALTVVNDQVLNTNNRDSAPDVVLIVSAGQTNTWTTETLQAVNVLKAFNTRIIPVGLFNGITDAQLQQLATDPAEIVRARNADVLLAETSRVQELACQHRIQGKNFTILTQNLFPDIRSGNALQSQVHSNYIIN